jgi:hypothetical protein
MNLNCFCNERKPMFPKSWRTMNLNCFRNERKPMLGLFSTVSEPDEIRFAFTMSEGQQCDGFLGIQKHSVL